MADNKDHKELNTEVLSDHYRVLASQYDRFFRAQSRARADFIKKHVSLTQDDQVIDIGGGTAQVSLMLKEDLKMSKPVVCVDPSKEMLEVAKKNGAITVQSTAEEFFASKPPYSLKLVLMLGCAHHFVDSNLIFTNLAKFMPSDGVCFLLEYPREKDTTLPLFKAAKLARASSKSGNQFVEIQALAESKLKSRAVYGAEPVEMDKVLWYECIKGRLFSSMENFTDQELEEGIKELDGEFKGTDVIKFDLSLQGIIMTRK